MRSIRKNTKKIKIKIVISLSAFLIMLIYACDKSDQKEEVVTIVNKRDNRIEKGLLVEGKREGYWVSFDTNYVIQYDIQYKNDIPNGKTTHYSNGGISMEAEMRDGKRDGRYTSYYKYPIIATQGTVKMGTRIGEWRTYAEDGSLDKIIQFEMDTFRVILDNKLE